MGVVNNIDAKSFPKQGMFLGREVDVCFHYNLNEIVKGKIVRDDMEDPFRTIIALEDGRYVLSNECQYSPK